jgi:hypothetical protein
VVDAPPVRRVPVTVLRGGLLLASGLLVPGLAAAGGLTLIVAAALIGRRRTSS